MQTFYNVSLGLGLAVAIVFSLVVYATGKGDAMSGGGGSVRTSFKGKSSFDDKMSQITLYLGVGFMVLMIVVDIIGNNVHKR